MPVSDQLIDQLLADYESPEDLPGEQGILRQLTKNLLSVLLKLGWNCILVMPNMMPPEKTPVTPATVKAVNQYAAFTATLSLKHRETVMAAKTD